MFILVVSSAWITWFSIDTDSRQILCSKTVFAPTVVYFIDHGARILKDPITTARLCIISSGNIIQSFKKRKKQKQKCSAAAHGSTRSSCRPFHLLVCIISLVLPHQPSLHNFIKDSLYYTLVEAVRYYLQQTRTRQVPMVPSRSFSHHRLSALASHRGGSYRKCLSTCSSAIMINLQLFSMHTLT